MRVQGRRKRGRPKRRWVDRVRDPIKEKGLLMEEVYDRVTWRRIIYNCTSTPHTSGNKMKRRRRRNKKKIAFDMVGVAAKGSASVANVLDASSNHNELKCGGR